MILPFRRVGRRLRVSELRGEAGPVYPTDLAEHSWRSPAVPASPYPGPPPHTETQHPVKRFFPAEKPDREHLWFDRRFSVFFTQGNSADGAVVAASFDFTPPQPLRAVVQAVGWAEDGYLLQGLGKLGLLVNGAPWRDWLTDFITLQGIQDPNFFGVNPIVFTTDQVGLHDEDLVRVYIDLAPNDTLSVQVISSVDAGDTRVHGRIKGWFYWPERGRQD